MKCNQKTIGQGTVLKSPPHPQGSELVLWKGAILFSLVDLVGVLVQAQQ